MMIAHKPPLAKTSINPRIDAVIASAADLFLEVGYDALTIDRLIERAGGSRRNVYVHLGGKEGLFVRVVEHLCAELAMPIEAVAIVEGDLHSLLRSFGRALVSIVLSPRALSLHRLMIAEGCRFPQLAQTIYKAGQARAQDILATALSRSPDYTGIISTDMFAKSFVCLLVADVQLRALIGLVPLPLEDSHIDALVQDAIELICADYLPSKAYGQEEN